MLTARINTRGVRSHKENLISTHDANGKITSPNSLPSYWPNYRVGNVNRPIHLLLFSPSSQPSSIKDLTVNLCSLHRRDNRHKRHPFLSTPITNHHDVEPAHRPPHPSAARHLGVPQHHQERPAHDVHVVRKRAQQRRSPAGPQLRERVLGQDEQLRR